MKKKTLIKIDETIESLCVYIKTILDKNSIEYSDEITVATKALAELVSARAMLCEIEPAQEEDMFQHIRISGYVGVYSAIDIESNEDGKTYAIFKPDDGGTINLLCAIRDVDSLIYIANTSCSTVNDAFK